MEVKEEMKELVFLLTEPDGVSGVEFNAANKAKSLLEKYCDNVTINNRGTVVGYLQGEGKTIQLDAHIDQIGLIVTDIADNGFIKFDRCGSVDPRVLSGLEVIILGRENVYGIISSVPPHLAKPEDDGVAKDFNELAIDTGLSDEKCRELVNKGDRCIFKSYPFDLLGNEISSCACDDRAGVATIIHAVELIKESGKTHPNLIITFSVCEEVGGRGACTASFEDEVNEAIAVDVSFAYTPGCAKEETSAIGKGPMIGVSPVLSNKMSKQLQEIAKETDIPYQLEIMSGNTSTHADELSIAKDGIPSALISIPLKYMHTPCEVVDVEDLENVSKLISNYVLAQGESTND